MMVWVFWLAVGFVSYTLAGYQIVLWIISRFRCQEHRREDVTPTVTVIIVVHNEAATIGEKIQNTLAFDYPKDRLEVVVGSDGSQDATVEIIRSFAAAGVKLVDSPERRGKHHIQMLARDVARGEILVFTDASILAGPHVLQQMVSHFADKSIGAVSSVDRVSDTKKGWMGEHVYIYGEMGLRRLEARVSSLVSLSGALFAARRSLCDDWHPDQSSDFFVALHAVARGLRAVIDPECPASLGVVRSERVELSRKVRTIVHGLVVFFSHLSLLNPFRYGLFSWQLASHKLCRWLLPFAVIAVLISSAFLWKAGLFYRVFLIIQLIGYTAGSLSYLGGRATRLGPLKLASFFVLGNVATLVAWWKFCLGDRFVAWEPSQRG